MIKTSVFDEIGNIPTQVLSSDLPETVTATVLAATKTVKKGAFAGTPMLKLELLCTDGVTFSVNYRIPKARTGKSQLEMFEKQLKKLKLKPEQVIGQTFEWKKMDLEGSVQGNPRFYPVKLIPKKEK